MVDDTEWGRTALQEAEGIVAGYRRNLLRRRHRLWVTLEAVSVVGVFASAAIGVLSVRLLLGSNRSNTVACVAAVLSVLAILGFCVLRFVAYVNRSAFALLRSTAPDDSGDALAGLIGVEYRRYRRYRLLGWRMTEFACVAFTVAPFWGLVVFLAHWAQGTGDLGVLLGVEAVFMLVAIALIPVQRHASRKRRQWWA